MPLSLAQARDWVASVPDEAVITTKAQIMNLIDAAERGQAAEQKLADLEKAGITMVAA